MMKTELCKLKKTDIGKSFGEIEKHILNPQFICKKCIRVSNDKNLLCKAKRMGNK